MPGPYDIIEPLDEEDWLELCGEGYALSSRGAV